MQMNVQKNCKFHTYGFIINILQQKPALPIIHMPIKLNKQRLLIWGHFPLGAALVQLVKGIGGHRQHPHVRPEFLHKGADDIFNGGIWRHPDTFRGDLLTGVLEVKAHDTMKLEVLKMKEKQKC